MKRIKIILVAVILAACLILYKQIDVTKIIRDFMASIDAMGMWGMLVYCLVYIIATVFFIPGSLITLAAGFMYGPWLGTAVVSVASVCGAYIAFGVSRFMFSSRVLRLAEKYPKWSLYNKAIAKNGKKITLLLRLSPLFPFNVLNYLLGLSTISSKDYLWASWLGMLPGTFLYVYFGSLLESLTQKTTLHGMDLLYQRLFWAFGFMLTVVLVVYVSKISKKMLEKEQRNE